MAEVLGDFVAALDLPAIIIGNSVSGFPVARLAMTFEEMHRLYVCRL